MARVADIAIISDGKAGHVNQSYGLADALRRLQPQLQVREFPALSTGKALARLMLPDDSLRGTRMLIGAGHQTHLTLLACRRAAGCPAVVLMNPSLPVACFDLCIRPRHDGGRESQGLWLSDGPLNRMRPASGERNGPGLILIGGPSPHFDWSEAAILGQLTRLCDGSSQWMLSTSRRTPGSFLRGVKSMELPGLEIHDYRKQAPGWLLATLPSVANCWVTPDSASMVYEALSSGCAVGLLDLRPKSGSRIAKGMASMRERGLVTGFQQFDFGQELTPLDPPFAEADRMAQRLIERGWF